MKNQRTLALILPDSLSDGLHELAAEARISAEDYAREALAQHVIDVLMRQALEDSDIDLSGWDAPAGQTLH